jgi:beta-alanine degradation protein BauB
MGNAHSATAADNDQVRVTNWTFAGSGAATGHHVHEFDYVVVPITGGTFAVTALDGSVHEMTQLPGVAYFGTQGTAHDVASSTDLPAVFVEVEIKR